MKRAASRKRTHPLIGIIMGSSSDAGHLEPAREMLRQFDVPFEFKVVSAHRTPDQMFRYAEQASGRGIEVIIAAAGGAAHLPGMVASKTFLPVIGVPVKSKALNGLDSLLSIVQMPAGIPVATVAIDGAANAALLALRMLGIKYPEIQKLLDRYRKDLEAKVLAMKV
ncbi:MAG: 5-(carboxyamino)imidazole ribonucleotide mutase [Ignavibacteriales bacterium]|nr:5-(carboxyamino)imidazole ribonucleotide mutase [Ignavibacteriales bacterium]